MIEEGRFPIRPAPPARSAPHARGAHGARAALADHLRQDLRCAFRNIRRYPVAALVAVISLAGGIAATTVTLMIRDVLFHKAPPLYVEPSALSRVQIGSPEHPIMPIGSYVPAALYASWRETLDLPMAAAGLARGERELRVADRTEAVQVRRVTPEFFDVLGIRAEAGQVLAPATASAVGPAPAVLSYRVWERLFDARHDAIGRPIWIDNQPYTVVGVLPRAVWSSDFGSPVWTLLDPRGGVRKKG